MFKKKKFKRGGKRLPRFLFSGIFLTPFLIFITSMCFFLADDFMVMYTVRSLEDAQTSDAPYVINDWSVDPSNSYSAGSGVADYGNSVLGANGLSGMYINKVTGGYCAEYLNIVKGHCSWEYMNPNVNPLYKNGEPVYPSVISVLGLTLCESGTIGGKGEAVKAVLNIDKYKENSEYDLYNFNSAVASRAGKSYLSSGMDLDLKYGGYYYTPFQFSKGMAAVYPSGTVEVTNSTLYPSKMNGFGFAESTVRTKSDTDAAYLPDNISIAIQYSFSTASKYLDMTTANDATICCIQYPIYNGGPGLVQSTWASGAPTSYDWHVSNSKFSGSSNAGWLTASGVTNKQCATAAVNIIADYSVKLCEEFARQYDSTGSAPFLAYDHMAYEGVTTTSLLLNGGFIATDTSLVRLKNKMSNASFQKGATFAYRYWKQDKTASWINVEAFLKSVQKTSLPAFYGPAQTGKPSSTEVVIHMYDPNISVYNNNREGRQPLLHAYTMEACRGSVMSYIGGVWVYRQMLLAAGVECSMVDAWLDGTGQKIIDEGSGQTGPSGSTSGELVDKVGTAGGSYYFGTRQIGNMSSYAWDIVQSMNSSMMTNRYITDVSNGIHWGEDYGFATGTPMYSICDGYVVNCWWNKYRGWVVQLAFEDSSPDAKPTYVIYQHLKNKSNVVKPGDKVKQGDLIAYSGNTGVGTGAHLHIELWTLRDGSGKYYFSYRGVAEQLYTIAEAPALLKGPDSSDGGVFDGKLNKLGHVTDLPTQNHARNFYSGGINYFRK